MEKKYLTREEAAEYLGISLGQLAVLLKEPNPLPVFRLGRRLVFRASEIDSWLDRYRVSGGKEMAQ
jgi:excisionase family DNA binding protein